MLKSAVSTSPFWTMLPCCHFAIFPLIYMLYVTFPGHDSLILLPFDKKKKKKIVCIVQAGNTGARSGAGISGWCRACAKKSADTVHDKSLKDLIKRDEVRGVVAPLSVPSSAHPHEMSFYSTETRSRGWRGKIVTWLKQMCVWGFAHVQSEQVSGPWASVTQITSGYR